jgi:hypothetical protein
MVARRTTGVAALAAMVLGLLVTAPQAAAEYEQYAMNGTFSVVANGEWATMNDRYQDQPTVNSTWTVASVCTSAYVCTGKVTSSLGWTEDVYTTSGEQWFVKHDVAEWIPCPDGTKAAGLQIYKFYRANDAGTQDLTSTTWIGEDQTTGVSGNCGRNRSLLLSMPLKITEVR